MTIRPIVNVTVPLSCTHLTGKGLIFPDWEAPPMDPLKGEAEEEERGPEVSKEAKPTGI